MLADHCLAASRSRRHVLRRRGGVGVQSRWPRLGRSRLAVFHSHARLDDVDDIVAQLLALVDDVHVDGADAVCVGVVVHVADVQAAQLVAEVVYLALGVERAVYVETLLAPAHQAVHLREGLLGEVHHLAHVLVLLRGEMLLLALHLAAYGARDVVAGVADALYLGYLAQHGAYLAFRVVGEVVVANVIQVCGDFYLHVVRDVLIFLYSREQLCKLGLVLLLQQPAHHHEHALHALGERLYLLLCLEH